jgi:hypothetical protein
MSVYSSFTGGSLPRSARQKVDSDLKAHHFTLGSDHDHAAAIATNYKQTFVPI